MPRSTTDSITFALFQSAPVVADGRCSPSPTHLCTPERFNPRPSLPTGDARRCAGRKAGTIVSIRARRCRRAMRNMGVLLGGSPHVSIRARRCRRAMRPYAPHASDRELFQSAPVVADGRCPVVVRAGDLVTWFQSAPVVADGRCMHASDMVFMLDMFQSAPVVADGRCAVVSRTVARGPLFQSAPVVADGRCALRRRVVLGGRRVSIRARRCRRAMPCGYISSAYFDWFQSAPVVADGRCGLGALVERAMVGFNPRPSLPTGDARGNRRSIHIIIVSIRARRCRRAMPDGGPKMTAIREFQSAPVVADGRCNQDSSLPSHTGQFQSAPVVADGRCPRSTRLIVRCCRFQSAPVVADGRCGTMIACIDACERFNPRPSLPTGDAPVRDACCQATEVSIRARRCRRAMRMG